MDHEHFFWASSTGAARRRRQRRMQLALEPFSLSGSSSTGSFGSQNNQKSGGAFVNLDDGRNRIPLRKPSLSEQVVYGPAITPSTVKSRRSMTSRVEEWVPISVAAGC